jgi:heme-degrading monooxygenase HmoA
MVAREWHAVATLDGARQYADYVRSQLVPAVRALPGFVDLLLLTNARDDRNVDLVVLSIWESLDDMRGFAGDDVSRAVVEPHAARLLAAFDATVTLFEVAAISRAPGAARGSNTRP